MGYGRNGEDTGWQCWRGRRHPQKDIAEMRLQPEELEWVGGHTTAVETWPDDVLSSVHHSATPPPPQGMY